MAVSIDLCTEQQIKDRSMDNVQFQEIFDIVKSTENCDITLIWYEEFIEAELKQAMEQLNGHVVTCISRDIFVDSINSIQNETIIVIIAGKLAVDVLPIIHDNTNIDSVYLFCMNEIYYQNLLNSYSKICGIYSEYDILFDSIKNKIRSLIPKLVTFSLFRQTDKSIRDLSRESGSFLWYELAKEYLINMTTSKTEAAKQEMIALCRIYYQSNQSYLKKIDEFEQTYEATDALKWYTKDTFLFRLLNKSLRCEDIELFYSFRYYLVDLCTALKREYDSLKDDLPSMIITLYRGQTLDDDEINKLKTNINQLISTNGFLSTTWSPDVARAFSANVLYEINIDLSENEIDHIRFANVSQYSEVPDEQEVLIDLGATFKILDVQYDGNFWIVKMSSIKEQQQIKYEFMEEMKNQISTLGWTEYYFGDLIGKIGQPAKALRYFQRLVQCTTNDRRQQYIAYCGLAHAYDHMAQYDLALNHMLTAYELCNISEEIVDSRDLSQILYSLGYIYSNRGDDELAIEHYERSLKALPDQQQNQAKNLIGMACVSYRQGKYDEALSFYELGLEIENVLYPRLSPYIANDLYYIARCHFSAGDYDLALNYFEQALEIQEQILPNIHVDIACTERYLGMTHRRLGNYENGEEHCTKALLIREKMLPYSMRDVASLHFEIGLCNAAKNDYESSISHYNQTLTLYEKLFPFHSAELAHVYCFMGSAYYHSHQYDLAIEQRRKALNIYEHILPINRTKIVQLLWELVVVYEQKKDYDSIITICQQLLSIQEKITPTDRDQLTILFKTTAACYFQLENYNRAIEFFQKALLTQEQSREIEIAELLNDLGCCLLKLGQYKMAMEHCYQSKQLLEKHIETNREHYGNVLNSLAHIHYETRNYDQAYNDCLKSLDILTGRNHPAVISNYEILTNIFKKKDHDRIRKADLFTKITIATAFGFLILQALKMLF